MALDRREMVGVWPDGLTLGGAGGIPWLDMVEVRAIPSDFPQYG